MRRSVVRDVMTKGVVSARANTPYKEIVALMEDFDVTALPVVDAYNVVIGVVSEADLLLKEEYPPPVEPAPVLERKRRRVERAKSRGTIAADLMTSPAITVQANVPIGEAARLMHEKGVKRLPVVDDLGKLGGIVSRRDLLAVFMRGDKDIREEIAGAVLRETLWLDPKEVQVNVSNGVVTLEGKVETYTLRDLVVELTYGVEGVVSVASKLGYELDDRKVRPDMGQPWGVLPRSMQRP